MAISGVTPMNVVQKINLKALNLESIKRKIQTNIFDIRLLETQNKKFLEGKFFKVKQNGDFWPGKFVAYDSINSLSPNGETLLLNVRLLVQDKRTGAWTDNLGSRTEAIKIDHLEMLNGLPSGVRK